MTGKVVNENPAANLILILPVAAAIIFLYEAWLYLLGLLLVIIAWKVWDNYQWQQWCGQINPLFNQLVKENQGCLTPMDLSIKGNLTGNAARRFLERKAEEYGAYRRQLQDKSVVYYFISASTLGNIFDTSEFAGNDLNLSQLPASASAAVVLDPPSSLAPPLTDPISSTVTLSSTPISTSTPAPPSIPASSPDPHNAIAHLAQIKEARQQDARLEAPLPESINPITAALLSTPEQEESERLSPGSHLEITTEPLAPETPLEATLESELESTTHQPVDLTHSLIQADLAKRLDTTSSTIARRKSDPEFPLWSQSKDPEGVAWIYLDREKVFMPKSD